MEYPLPQFLEIKPKIVGPFTFRQFLYFLAGGLILLYFYFTKPWQTFLLMTVIVMTISAILAFVKVQGYPIPTLIVRAFGFLFKSKIYIWKKGSVPTYSFPQAPSKEPGSRVQMPTIKKTRKSRLQELSKMVEIHQK